MNKLPKVQRGNVETLIPKHDQTQSTTPVTAKSQALYLTNSNQSVSAKPSLIDSIKSAFSKVSTNVGINYDQRSGIIKLKGINDPIDIAINATAKALGLNNKSYSDILFSDKKEIEIHTPLNNTRQYPSLVHKPKGSTIEYTILPYDVRFSVDNFRCMFKLETKYNANWRSLLHDLVDAAYTKQSNTYSKMIVTLVDTDEEVYLPAATLLNIAINAGLISYK